MRLARTILFFLAIAALAAAPRVRAFGGQSSPPAAAGPISPEALAQIEALIAEKESRSATEQKIDSQLLYEMRMRSGLAAAPGIAAVETDVPYAPDGHAVVDVKAKLSDELDAALAALGAEVLSISPADSAIRIHIGIEKIKALAALPGVIFVEPRQDATTSGMGQSQQTTNVLETNTGQGSRSSEGDITHLAFAARAAFEARGAGVKIGVLSNGVTNLAASQASGDLGPVTVLPGQVGSADEGTAMLEIIHDLAPDAQLYFATSLGGITTFADNIRALRAAGCDIVVDDGFYFVESPFHDGQAEGVVSPRNMGVVTQAINEVTASGALYFSAAGNAGNLNDGTSGTWEGDFADGGPTAGPVPAGNRLHSFGGQSFNILTAATTNPISLFWSDPLGASTNDYDLFILNATGTSVLASSTNIQSGTLDPYEQVSGAAAAAGSRIVIVKKGTAEPRFLHLATHRGRLSIATAGEIHGHAQAPAAFAVAATPAVGPFPGPFTSTSVVETFSSDGPRRVFFRPDNTPYTPGDFSGSGGEVHQKPDITAADGVSVSGGSPFVGTSASAAHAAAIAALLKSANHSLTPAQIRAALLASAIDIEAPGVDRDSGAGIIMADGALRAAGVPGTAFIEVAAVQASDAPGNGNGTPEAGEGATLVIPLGNYGGASATAVSATLTSSTSGITITQPSATAYPNLAPSVTANGAAPFRFTVASEFPCPQSADFRLTVNYTGGPSPRVFQFQVPIGLTSYSITKNLDGTVPPPSAGVSTATGIQNFRLFRDNIASTCGSQKATPALAANTFGATNRQFDAYTFKTCSSVPACVTVSLQGTNAINLFSAAYSPTFNSADIQQNYRADAGSSGPSKTYSLDMPASAASLAVDVHDVAQGLTAPSGTAYTLKVSGACMGACDPPNRVPVARARDVTVSAGPSCTANASIDDGSSDPDGDPLTLTQTPAGPYPLGRTTVLLTVSDPKGATSQASAVVTVVDTTAPDVIDLSVGAPAMWPPDHRMVDIAVNYGVTDCTGATCVLSVTSNEPINGTGDADTAPDWEIVDPHHVRLRAERAGSGSGRIYTITVTCTDGAGNRTVKTTTVLVPHS